MMIPGSNILNLALSVIQKQSFTYFAFKARTLNAIGFNVAEYKPGIPAKGSVQPIPRNLYQASGLDFQRNYFNFFLSKGIIDIARDVSGDQFEYNGLRFQCLSKTDWYAADGWDQVLCVQVSEVAKC